MNGNTKNWLLGISIGTTIIIALCGGMVWYVYAEATGSRLRDSQEIVKRSEADTSIRSEMRDDRMAQMDLLHKIDNRTIGMAKDIEHLKG